MSKPRRFRVSLDKYERMDAASIRIPFDVKEVFGTRGRVPVRGTVNGFPFRSSIFPMKGGGHYMVVNRETRAGAGVRPGEVVSIVMERDEEPRVVTPPPDLERALKANGTARAAWDKLSYTHQKEHAKAVEEAKRPETRARRVEKAIEQLTAGTKS